MDNVFHITNGDHFTSTLKKLPIKGNIITWSEMLCEGKTVTNIGSTHFWKTRYGFFKHTYKITKNLYLPILREYKNLCDQKTQEEAVLWFDNNLSGQINMIAMVSWLRNHKKNIQVSLVSGSSDDMSRTLADLSEAELTQQYENRLHLTEDDVNYADYVWQLYCSDNPLRLETFAKFNASQFQHLTDAIKAHILRFPTIKTGLNTIENDVLRTALEQKPQSREALVKQMLDSENTYGYTDFQYRKIIRNLKSLFQSFSPVKLTPTGEALLNNTANYYAVMRNDDAYLGGSRKYSYLYNTTTDKLLKL